MQHQQPSNKHRSSQRPETSIRRGSDAGSGDVHLEFSVPGAAAANLVRVQIVHGDITEEQVDAIVNPANQRLAHGGGAAGAVARRGGPSIQEESDAWVATHGPVPTGSAAMTSGGELAARHVIHAVGPVWSGRTPEEDDAHLASAIRSALDLAAAHHLRSISIPAISSGIFGFPKKRCAEVFLRTIAAWVTESTEGAPELIRLCNFDDETVSIFVDVARGFLASRRAT